MMLLCKRCKRSFEVETKKGRPPLFCSYYCKENRLEPFSPPDIVVMKGDLVHQHWLIKDRDVQIRYYRRELKRIMSEAYRALTEQPRLIGRRAPTKKISFTQAEKYLTEQTKEPILTKGGKNSKSSKRRRRNEV